MPLTKPLNNNVLIEVIKDDDGVSRTDANESLKRGRVVDVSFSPVHLTASAGFDLTLVKAAIEAQFPEQRLIKQGLIVRWEEFAESGQTFEEDGKTFAIVPWWRLISYEVEE